MGCTFIHEERYWQDGYVVIGVDEVGRGCLAGPVFVGGVCIDPGKRALFENYDIRDSKKLTARQRAKLAPYIQNHALCWSIQSSPVAMINERGIVAAVHDAAQRVVQDMCTRMRGQMCYLLGDAFEIPSVGVPQQALVGGDSVSISIAAAAIIAKVARDAHMEELHTGYPQYGWDRNKGYGTNVHREAIVHYGLTEHHRELFVRKIASVYKGEMKQ